MNEQQARRQIGASTRHTARRELALLALLTAGMLSACGGNDDTPAPTPNAAPVATITAPAAGGTFRAGDTLTFAGSATDTEDGTLGAARLTWWVDLHHDTHTHPAVQPTQGDSGSFTVPTQGETSDNIWYRFHLRATDSANQSVEVTRDVLPQKAQVTLATVPAGLQLTLDGQPVAAAPLVFTGVVGIERTLGAANQNFNGRRYVFASWSDGGNGTHTIATPAANTTYTATFTDDGPVVNQPPTVSLATAESGTVGVAQTLTATAADSDGTIARVEFFENGNRLGEDTSSPYTLSWTPATSGSRSLTARATDNSGGVTDSTGVSVNVAPATGPDTQPPTIALTAPADLQTGITGTLSITANANDNVGVAGVEFQVDGVAIGSEDTAAPYAANVDASLYTAGQHVVRARARDAAGNRSAWASATIRVGGSRSIQNGFTKDESWISGLQSATAFAQAPDGRIFVAQQGGLLRVVRNGTLLPTPFRTFSVNSEGERGLLGVAFHPDFASNGWVYVYYTATSGGIHNRVSRLVASNVNPDVSNGTETVLVDLPNLSTATNHNGGALHFGLDGKLYVAVGDNANGAKAQDLADPFGKMLRFNDDGSIPSDNPFYNQQTGLARAIWAYGLRNPFTFAVQPGTGRLHINDVGQNTWEEVNVGAPGANYGWPGSEGPDNVSGSITGPLFTYRHSNTSPAGSGPGGFFVGFAIAGGTFYPASGPFPAAYRGNYFFADYVSHFVGRLDAANNYAAYAFATLGGAPVDMLAGADGALYVLTRSAITRISSP